MSAIIILPDVETLAIAYLKTLPEFTGVTVVSKLPPKVVYPVLTVSNIGGVPIIDWHLGADILQLDAWGKTRAQARSLILTAHGALVAWRGKQDAGPVITGTATFSGVQSLPDPNHSHWLMRMRVFSHP